MISRGLSIEEQYEEARVHILKNELDTAIIELQEIAIEAAEGENYSIYLKCMNALGVAYAQLDNDNMAIDFYLKGMALSRVMNITGWNHLFYNNVGVRYQQLGDFREALKYYTDAEKELFANGEDEALASFYVINYLNQSDCYRRIGDVPNAQRCTDSAKEFAKKYNIESCNYSLVISQAYLDWYSGNREAVYAALDSMIAFAKNGEDTVIDYARNTRELVEILSNMEEYDRVYEIIGYFDEYVTKSDSIYLRMQLTELYMDYYSKIEDVESYRNVCVEHVAYYRDYKVMKEQDDILALNVKIELQRAERALARNISEENK